MNEMVSSLFNSNEQMFKFIIYIILTIFVISILRSVFRAMMPILVIGLVMVVFLGFTPNEVINKGKQFAIDGSHYFLDSFLPFLKNETIEKNEENKGVDIFGEPKREDPLNKL